MPRAPVIELLGAPASGKSGLARELARDPRTVLVKDHARRDLPSLLRGTARAWPVLLAEPPVGTDRWRWAAWAGRLAAASAVTGRYSSGSGDLVVLDQGPAYTLGRMVGVRLLPRGDHWWHRQACATAGLLAVLVVLDAEPDVLSRRLHERAKGHRAASLDDLETRRYLEAEQSTCRVVTDTLARAGTRVLHLDTGRLSLEDQVAAVHTAVALVRRRGDRRPA